MYKPTLFTEHKMPYRMRSLERDMILFKWKSETLKLPLSPEFWVTVNGSIGFKKNDKKWVVGTFNGILDEYGDFTTYVCHTLATDRVETYQLKNHEEVIVCGNTPLYRCFERERDYHAFMKEETDKSILCQLINTRFNQVFKVMNDQQRKQLIKAYKDVIAGMPLVLVTKLLEDIDLIDITDPKEIDKLQYLTSFYQSMEKREANASGIDLELLDKRAQVSNEEIKQYDDVTTLEYLTMYEKRMEFVEEMKENGFEISIEKNPIFYDEPDKEDINDGTFDAAEEPEVLEADGSKRKEENENDEDNKGTV